jgi:dUTP pyrophosphatase
MKPTLKIKKRLSNAVIPEYKKEKDSGFDLSICLDVNEPDVHCCVDEGVAYYTMAPLQTKLFDTGLTFEIPEGHEVQIRPRSGMACTHGITVINSPGTVDELYRGPIKVGLINLSGGYFQIKHGMRVAQAVLCPVVQADIIEVQDISENTDRGSGGFGSTGE